MPKGAYVHGIFDSTKRVIAGWNPNLTAHENAIIFGISRENAYRIAKVYHLEYVSPPGVPKIIETLEQYRNRIGSVSNYPMPQRRIDG